MSEKSKKPKRTHAEIRAEKHALVEQVNSCMAKIRDYITGKIPPLVVNGCHQDAVEFKEFCEANANIYECPPSLKKKPAKEIQARLDKLKGVCLKFNRFY